MNPQDNTLRRHSDEAIDKRWNVGRLQIPFRMTAGNGAMGRLGGGWAWKLGAMGARGELCSGLSGFGRQRIRHRIMLYAAQRAPRAMNHFTVEDIIRDELAKRPNSD